MKYITTVFVLLNVIFCLHLNAQTVINEGEVSGKWEKRNSPYRINGNITIPAGKTLEIEAGVIMLFNNNGGITINGKLLAIGTKYDSVVFTGQARHGWRGLSFNTVNDEASVIEYAKIEYANKNGNSISISNGAVTLNNNTISNGTYEKRDSYENGAIAFQIVLILILILVFIRRMKQMKYLP